ncbi:hypothetical protein ACRRTK_012905 [Alexandromys fortis]
MDCQMCAFFFYYLLNSGNVLGHGKDQCGFPSSPQPSLTPCCSSQHQQMGPLLCLASQQINGLSDVCLFFLLFTELRKRHEEASPPCHDAEMN